MNEHKKAKRKAKIERRRAERQAAKEKVADILEGFEAFKKKRAQEIALRSQVESAKKAKKEIEKARARAEGRGGEVDRLRERFYPEYRYFIQKHREDTLGICENVGLNNLSVENWGGLNCFDCGKVVATLDQIKAAQRDLLVEKADKAAEQLADLELGIHRDVKPDNLEIPNYLDESIGIGELDREDDCPELL